MSSSSQSSSPPASPVPGDHRPEQKRGHRRPFLTVRQITTLALLSSLVAVAKWSLRIPIRVPGHSGVLWIAVFVVGCGIVRRRGAGTIIGMVGGLLAAMLVPAAEGLLVFVKYAAAGVVLDLCVAAMGDQLDRVVPAMVAGALAHMAKLAANLLLGWALGIPLGFLALGIGGAATTHVLFGALGGLLGAIVLQRLTRSRIPSVRAIMDEGRRES
jgi:hypothetical protein